METIECNGGLMIPILSLVKYIGPEAKNYGMGRIIGFQAGNDYTQDRIDLLMENAHPTRKMLLSDIYRWIPKTMFEDTEKPYIVYFFPTDNQEGFAGYFSEADLEKVEEKINHAYQPPFSGSLLDRIDLDLITNGKKLPLKSDNRTPFFKTKKYNAIMVADEDKKTLVIGYHRFENPAQHPGCVYIQKDEDIVCLKSPLTNPENQFGSKLEISKDGNLLFIFEPVGGYCYVYIYENKTWRLREHYEPDLRTKA